MHRKEPDAYHRWSSVWPADGPHRPVHQSMDGCGNDTNAKQRTLLKRRKDDVLETACLGRSDHHCSQLVVIVWS